MYFYSTVMVPNKVYIYLGLECISYEYTYTLLVKVMTFRKFYVGKFSSFYMLKFTCTYHIKILFDFASTFLHIFKHPLLFNVHINIFFCQFLILIFTTL